MNTRLIYLLIALFFAPFKSAFALQYEGCTKESLLNLIDNLGYKSNSFITASIDDFKIIDSEYEDKDVYSKAEIKASCPTGLVLKSDNTLTEGFFVASCEGDPATWVVPDLECVDATKDGDEDSMSNFCTQENITEFAGKDTVENGLVKILNLSKNRTYGGEVRYLEAVVDIECDQIDENRDYALKGFDTRKTQVKLFCDHPEVNGNKDYTKLKQWDISKYKCIKQCKIQSPAIQTDEFQRSFKYNSAQVVSSTAGFINGGVDQSNVTNIPVNYLSPSYGATVFCKSSRMPIKSSKQGCDSEGKLLITPDTDCYKPGIKDRQQYERKACNLNSIRGNFYGIGEVERESNEGKNAVYEITKEYQDPLEIANETGDIVYPHGTEFDFQCSMPYSEEKTLRPTTKEEVSTADYLYDYFLEGEGNKKDFKVVCEHGALYRKINNSTFVPLSLSSPCVKKGNIKQLQMSVITGTNSDEIRQSSTGISSIKYTSNNVNVPSTAIEPNQNIRVYFETGYGSYGEGGLDYYDTKFNKDSGLFENVRIVAKNTCSSDDIAITKDNSKNQYNNGETLSFNCPPDHVPNTTPTCNNGQWLDDNGSKVTSIKCLKPCDLQDIRNKTDLTTNDTGFVKSSEKYDYAYCSNSNQRPILQQINDTSSLNSRYFKPVQCYNGQWIGLNKLQCEDVCFESDISLTGSPNRVTHDSQAMDGGFNFFSRGDSVSYDCSNYSDYEGVISNYYVIRNYFSNLTTGGRENNENTNRDVICNSNSQWSSASMACGYHDTKYKWNCNITCAFPATVGNRSHNRSFAQKNRPGRSELVSVCEGTTASFCFSVLFGKICNTQSWQRNDNENHISCYNEY